MPFNTELKVKYVNGRIWELLEDLIYVREVNEALQSIVVPAGFKCDMASIPRVFWFIIGPPTGKYGPAAVVHDFTYFKRLFSRSVCDRIFLEAMSDLNVSWWKRRTMWLAVRAFAWLGWDKHRSRNNEKD